MEGFRLWAAGDFLGLKLPSWETWIPLAAGMLAGVVSIVAVRYLGPRRRRIRPAPPAPTPKETPAPDPFVHGSALEQRRAFRRGGNPVPVVLMKPDAKEPDWRGWVFDRSVGGLGVIVDSEFALDTPLRILPVNAPQSTPWVDVYVKSCRAGEDGFELGCQFIRTPPWSVLLMFG